MLRALTGNRPLKQAGAPVAIAAPHAPSHHTPAE
jgi:hypothetical protein